MNENQKIRLWLMRCIFQIEIFNAQMKEAIEKQASRQNSSKLFDENKNRHM